MVRRAKESYPTCQACGLPAAPEYNARGSKVGDHTPGGVVCRRASDVAAAAAWAKEAAARGLVRVTGGVASTLAQHVPPTYGKHYMTAADLEEQRVQNGWYKNQGRVGVVTSAYFPRWLVYIEQAFGDFDSEAKKEAIRLCADADFQQAVMTVADLSASPAEARKAVVALCRREQP